MDGRVEKIADPQRRALTAVIIGTPLAVIGAASFRASAQMRAAAGDLARAVDAYNRATLANDTAALADLIAEDYILVNSDTSLQDKQSYLEDFNLPGFRIEPYEMQEPLLRDWGETALTGWRFDLAWAQNGARHRRRLRIAHLWTRRTGRWQIAYTQLTRVPDLPA
jgi:ketosteroid isomerase-like protein